MNSKQMIVIVGFLSAFTMVSMQDGRAQAYHPMTKNYGWCLEAGVQLGSWDEAVYNKTVTILNGKKYHVFEDGHTPDDVLIRENTITQKVWVLYPDSTTEYLLYDFSLLPGDSFEIKYHGFKISHTYLITDTGHVQTPLGTRRTLRLNPVDTIILDSLILLPFDWIEGVGATSHPIYTYTPVIQQILPGPYPGYHMICCVFLEPAVLSFSQDCLFSICAPFQGPCYEMITSREEIAEQNAFEWVRTPQSIIVKGKPGLSLTANLLDLQGRTIIHSKTRTNRLTLNTMSLSSGVYFLSVRNGDGQGMTYKVFVD